MSAVRPFRFVSSDRRVREDRRFVAGKGRFAADILLPGTRHVAVVTCPHPAARILHIDKTAALASRGVHYVLDGRELAAATAPLLAGLDTPKVPRRPLAVEGERSEARPRLGEGETVQMDVALTAQRRLSTTCGPRSCRSRLSK